MNLVSAVAGQDHAITMKAISNMRSETKRLSTCRHTSAFYNAAKTTGRLLNEIFFGQGHQRICRSGRLGPHDIRPPLPEGKKCKRPSSGKDLARDAPMTADGLNNR
jgi:hypothetical protein